MSSLRLILAALLHPSCASTCTAFAQGGATVSGQVVGRNRRRAARRQRRPAPAGARSAARNRDRRRRASTASTTCRRAGRAHVPPDQLQHRPPHGHRDGRRHRDRQRHDARRRRAPTSSSRRRARSATSPRSRTRPRTWSASPRPAAKARSPPRSWPCGRSTAPPRCSRPCRAWSSASTAARARPTSTTCAASTSITASTSRQTDRRHPGEHADARARAGLRRLELPDPRTGERRAVPQGPVLRGERRLLVGGLGQHQLLQRPRPADRRRSPAARSTTAASSAPPPRRSGAGNLLAAFEWERDNGPWVSPNNKDKFNGVRPLQPGQRAQRPVADVPGLLEPLALDRPDSAARRRRRRSSTGSASSRRPTAARPTATPASSTGSGRAPTTRRASPAYVQRYGVQLFHNFTYFLNDPDNGDQFEQFEERWTTGAKLTHRRLQRVGGKSTENAVRRRRPQRLGRRPARPLPHAGDRAARDRCAPTRRTRRRSASSARRRSSGAASVRTTFGLRGDVYRWNVDVEQPAQLGQRRRRPSSARRSPRRSARGAAPSSTPTGALGFHSNSALGIMLHVDPFTGDPADAVAAVRARQRRRVRRAHGGASRACRRRRRCGTSASTPS